MKFLFFEKSRRLLFQYQVHMMLACAVLVAFAVPAHASLIRNGSFEQGPFPTNFQTIYAGSTRIPFWEVTQGEIDVSASKSYQYYASDGNFSIDLSGYNAGAIAQTFATDPGIQYIVEFDFAGNPNGGPSIKEMELSAAGKSQFFNFDITGYSPTNPGWEKRTWLFIANDTATTLEFTSLTGGWYGPVIDNVSVNAVPIPPAIWLLGSVLIGILGFRRKFRLPKC